MSHITPPLGTAISGVLDRNPRVKPRLRALIRARRRYTPGAGSRESAPLIGPGARRPGPLDQARIPRLTFDVDPCQGGNERQGGDAEYGHGPEAASAEGPIERSGCPGQQSADDTDCDRSVDRLRGSGEARRYQAPEYAHAGEMQERKAQPVKRLDQRHRSDIGSDRHDRPTYRTRGGGNRHRTGRTDSVEQPRPDLFIYVLESDQRTIQSAHAIRNE